MIKRFPMQDRVGKNQNIAALDGCCCSLRYGRPEGFAQCCPPIFPWIAMPGGSLFSKVYNAVCCSANSSGL